MKWLGLIKQFPKFAIVALLLFGSTALFGAWWLLHSPDRVKQSQATDMKKAVIVAEKVTIAEDRMGHLFLAGDDLYDVETGQLIFKDWLGGDSPSKLFYEREAKQLLAVFPRGLARYGLDGTRQAALKTPFSITFIDGLKSVLYAKEKDIWKADVDLQKLVLVKERRITSMGIFNERFFTDNFIMASDRFLVVRNLNQQLRINLESGEVKPTIIPMAGISKRRSPDGRTLAGVQGNVFFLYDLDTDKLTNFPEKRLAVTDYQWLDNDRCALLVMGKGVAVFDRKAGKIEEIAELPFLCQGIGLPSTKGSNVFCYSNRGMLIVDLAKKVVEPSPSGSQGHVWLDDETLLFMREIPDSALRGTWIKPKGQDEQRITPEPYLEHRNAGSMVMVMKESNQVVFATRHGISRVMSDGTGFAEVFKTSRLPVRLLEVEAWKPNL